MIQLCYNADVCNHLPSHRPCNLHRHGHGNRLTLFGREHETSSGPSTRVMQTVGNEVVYKESWRVKGLRGTNRKWHVHPEAPPNNFSEERMRLISPLSSLTGLQGVMCKHGSVMNLFSSSKPPCCLLNHLCSTRATVLSPTAALPPKVSTAESAVDCKQMKFSCPVRR